MMSGHFCHTNSEIKLPSALNPKQKLAIERLLVLLESNSESSWGPRWVKEQKQGVFDALRTAFQKADRPDLKKKGPIDWEQVLELLPVEYKNSFTQLGDAKSKEKNLQKYQSTQPQRLKKLIKDLDLFLKKNSPDIFNLALVKQDSPALHSRLSRMHKELKIKESLYTWTKSLLEEEWKVKFSNGVIATPTKKIFIPDKTALIKELEIFLIERNHSDNIERIWSPHILKLENCGLYHRILKTKLPGISNEEFWQDLLNNLPPSLQNTYIQKSTPRKILANKLLRNKRLLEKTKITPYDLISIPSKYNYLPLLRELCPGDDSFGINWLKVQNALPPRFAAIYTPTREFHQIDTFKPDISQRFVDNNSERIKNKLHKLNLVDNEDRKKLITGNGSDISETQKQILEAIIFEARSGNQTAEELIKNIAKNRITHEISYLNLHYPIYKYTNVSLHDSKQIAESLIYLCDKPKEYLKYLENILTNLNSRNSGN